MAAGRKLALAAVGFALAAALSSWNPIAAPFGLVVGLVALIISVRAVRLGGRQVIASIALAVSILAVLASGLVLALTAGVGREPTGAPVVSGATRDEATGMLDREEERTRAARARAREELEKVGGAPAPPPRKPEKGSR